MDDQVQFPGLPLSHLFVYHQLYSLLYPFCLPRLFSQLPSQIFCNLHHFINFVTVVRHSSLCFVLSLADLPHLVVPLGVKIHARSTGPVRPANLLRLNLQALQGLLRQACTGHVGPECTDGALYSALCTVLSTEDARVFHWSSRFFLFWFFFVLFLLSCAFASLSGILSSLL